jgi:hypothetical protein
MRQWLNPLANLLAAIGILLVIVAGFARVSGYYSVAGIGAIGVMQAGMAAMLAACLGKLEILRGMKS